MSQTAETTTTTSLCEAFQRRITEHPDTVALRTPNDSVTVTWGQFGERVRRIAAGLAALGVGKGDTVGLMLTNRPEYHLCDAAAMHLGAVPFSLYNTSAPEQMSYVFSNADNRVICCDRQFLARVKDAGGVPHVVCVDELADDDPSDGVLSLAELEELGERPEHADFDFDAAWRAVGPEDLITIIYTSGTTGPPKGVELTHANVIAEAEAVKELFDTQFGDRVLSYLPAAHIADRVTTQYSAMLFGTQVTCVADPRQLGEALPRTRPHSFFAVPRVWQKLKAGIDTALAGEPKLRQQIATWAIDTGIRHAKAELAGRQVPAMLRLQHTLADRLVLAKLRHKIGLDQVKAPASGASAIAPETLEYFWGLGIPIYEVWGMSETGGASTTNFPGGVKIGTVGRAMRGVELKLADDGELLTRGPTVTRGYRGEPEKTAEAIDADGWLHTGDIATIDEDGYVTIVDRKKELIISSGGKNMSPSNIENAMKAASSLIGPVVAIGNDRPYVVAMLVLDPDAAAALASRLGLSETSPAELAANPEVRATVTAAVRAGNQRLSRAEQVKRFRLVPAIWEPGGDELTPTLKLRRKPISEKYAHEIDELYADNPGEDVIEVGSSAG